MRPLLHQISAAAVCGLHQQGRCKGLKPLRVLLRLHVLPTAADLQLSVQVIHLR
jgi:hypothetical protein